MTLEKALLVLAESRKRAENGGEIKIIGKEKTTQKYMSENDINFQLTNQGGWC